MNTPKRTTSGQHEAVQAYRKKMDSVREGTLEELLDLNRQLDEEIAAHKDPRRDGDSDPPVDVIDLGDLIPGPEDDDHDA